MEKRRAKWGLAEAAPPWNPLQMRCVLRLGLRIAAPTSAHPLRWRCCGRKLWNEDRAPQGNPTGAPQRPLGRAERDCKGKTVVENGLPFAAPLHTFPALGKYVAIAMAKTGIAPLREQTPYSPLLRSTHTAAIITAASTRATASRRAKVSTFIRVRPSPS